MNTVNNAVFFISTGRCATQFFADKLSQNYGDLANVTHEPVRDHYKPRHYYSIIKKGEKIMLDSKLQEHIKHIEKTLSKRHYIETGWPSYGLLPYLIERFNGKVKIVHLYRHPVKVAASLATHNVYSRKGWSEEMSISPSDYGVSQPNLAGKRWEEMDEFCKCLFWWTEINNFALELNNQFNDVPWLSLSFEDVFEKSGNHALNNLTDFLGFPMRESFLNSAQKKVDRFSKKTAEKIEIKNIKRFNETLKVMTNLGYELNEISSSEIHKRYNEPLFLNKLGKMSRIINNFLR